MTEYFRIEYGIPTTRRHLTTPHFRRVHLKHGRVIETKYTAKGCKTNYSPTMF